MGPNIGLERRVSQFYTICDENQLLNKNIGKVMAILVLISWDVSCQVARAENPVEGSGTTARNPTAAWRVVFAEFRTPLWLRRARFAS
jgi:hypothetical protein